MTTRRKYFILIITALLISSAVIFFTRRGRPSAVPPAAHKGGVFLKAVAVRTPYGWGYNILANDKVYIHQDFMPAAEGRRGFKTPEDALSVAGLVIGRISANQMPSITVRDLDSLGLLK